MQWCICVGILSCLLITNKAQGGQWELYETNPMKVLSSVYFLDQKRGWAVTIGDAILYTNDGGKTWTENFKIDDAHKAELKFFKGKVAELRDVFFINEVRGWVVGKGKNSIILHTTDGGLTWTYQESGLRPFTVRNPKAGKSVDLPKNLYSVYFATPQDGWAVGGFGTIIHTSDGGLSWERQKGGVSEILREVFFVDAETGWIVGRRGTILHTTSGGEGWFRPWKRQNSGTYVDLMGVNFVDKETGWAVGGRTVFHTTNGGDTWEEQVQFSETNSLWSVYFVDRNTGWVVGRGPIQHTEDGGKTWIAQPTNTPYGLTKIHCVDAQHCWAVGEHGTVLQYVDDSKLR